jgi:hypothetical protein
MIVAVCLALLIFAAPQVYINFFRPDIWLKLRRDRGNQQHELRILKDELFVAKCRIAGLFEVIFVLASAYGLVLNVPKLF